MALTQKSKKKSSHQLSLKLGIRKTDDDWLAEYQFI